MSQAYDCPLCTKRFRSTKRLGLHLIGAHRQACDLAVVSFHKKRVLCWCGATVRFGRFGQHLHDRGGPAAHLLEHLL